MADMLLGSAQGAVGSLLGRLTSALIDEAQQLSGVRSDVQFIKDEMESMHGFLLHFAEATGDGGDEDHRVRAWMKQVAEVAYASQNCVDLYVQSLGAGASAGSYLRRLPRLLWTLPARHRIARQIRELKVRAREVGERRIRYGVKAPKEQKPAKASSSLAAGDDEDKELEDARRRASAEFKPAAPLLEQLSRDVWKKTTLQTEEDAEAAAPRPKVIAILGDPDSRTNFAKKAKTWEDWDCMVWIEVGPFCTPSRLLRSILKKLSAPVPDQLEAWGHEKLVEKIRLHLKDKRFLVVLDDFWDRDGTHLWDCVKSCFPPGDCTPGSKIIITTGYLPQAKSLVPSEVYDVSSLQSDHRKELIYSYLEEAMGLVNSNNQNRYDLCDVLRDIISILVDAIPTCNFFLHVLYGNPNRTIDEFQRLLRDKLGSSPNKAKQVLKFAYDGLSSNCKSCLLHLSIFPLKTTFGQTGYAAHSRTRLAIFKRARLVRRWVAEGRVKKRGRLMSAMDEADHCFDVLAAHRFVIPKDTDATGKVKSCVMNDFIHDLIAEIAREETRDNIKLPPDLAHRLSISHEFQLAQAVQQVHATRSNTATMFLELLPSSTNLRGLEVLDLEDCKELTDHHLKNICNHVVKLKYLSIRNTDITKLPKKIGKLQFLETLDIRQTEVRAFAKRYTVLPKLKHLLAGNQPTDYISFDKLQYQETDVRQTKVRVFTKRRIELPKLKNLLSGDQPTGYISEGSTRVEKPFFTVQMPHCIGAMTELQVLTHIAVSKNASELTGICNLIHLRKLEVVLQDPEGRAFMHLYHAIGNLTRSLVSLSIRIIANNVNADMGMEEILLIPPKYLQKLEISGLINGLPPWVEKLKELTKITLHKTPLSPVDIKILGMLTSLRYLRLQEKSSSERTLAFSKDGFQSLVFLVIEFSGITSISFADEATTPQL
ncbi:putative disease resistance RPP13-like protein 3 [Setaria italica]|uniref:putative disease resistance RPP13-like protein 3 n=1 Tax=Setaria italica TaxID=4555 RepID=UPI00035089EE|nr:putative disease resistance RPP13-like protein 3 [Setaria italica]